MTVDSNYVTTRPLWDDETTLFGYFWLDKVNEYANSRGYNITDLDKELARRTPFETAITNQNPSFFHGFGHGNEDLFTGQLKEILLERNVNDSLMAGRITYLMSCLTGVRLGPSIIQKGGRAYAGYSDLFAWGEILAPYGYEFDISCGRYHWSWMDFTNVLANAVLAGKPLTEACAIAVERANAWIDFWSLSDDGSASQTIEVIIGDRDALKCLQDGAITPPAPENIHPRTAFAIGIKGFDVYIGKNMTINIGVSCQVGKCDFRGKTFRIFDEAGKELYVGSFVNYLNGINWSTVTFTVPTTEPGIHKWSILVEGDGVHQETVGRFWAWVHGYGTIHGYALDGSTKEPIVDARIAVHVVIEGVEIEFPTRTDAKGHYILKNIAEGFHNVSGEKSGYYTTSPIYQWQIYADEINRLDVTLERDYYSVKGVSSFQVWCLGPNFMSYLPVKGVKVVLKGIGEAYTDVYGYAAFRDVPPGTYEWEAGKSGFASATGTPQQVMPGYLTRMLVGLSSIRLIFGRVFDAETLQSIPGARVSCEYYEATTDEDGYFEFIDVVHPQIYNIIASKDGYVPRTKIVDIDGLEWANAVNFYLQAAGPQHVLTVKSSPVTGVPVTVDASPSGSTPTSVTVVDGQHTVSVPVEVET